MTDEEYLRNRLDRLNQNSHYGIMIDTEITDIVRSHIKRLEEKEMKATSTEEFKDIIAIDFELQTFPNPDTQDKFIVSATNRDDIFAFVFEGPNIVDACRKTGLFTGWEKDQRIKFLEAEIGRWKKEAADCLRLRDEAQKEAYKLKQENEKLTIEKVMLKEENEKLEKVSKEWEKEAVMFSDLRNKAKKDLALEKAANEAQHKFFVNYAGRGTEIEFNYAIGDTDEVTYVIVDKKTYDEKLNINLHGKDFTPYELVYRVLELEEENNRLKHEDMLDKNAADYWSKEHDTLLERFGKLQEENEKLKQMKTPTIENFSDEPTDNINHPSHYTGRYECIDVMQDVFGDEATDNFCLCNAFKYIWRARKKNGLEDVKKAIWYLNKYIEEAEKDGVPKGK